MEDLDKKYHLVAFSFPCVDQYYIKDKDGNVIPQKMTGGISCLNVLYNIALLKDDISSYIIGAVGNDRNGEKALESLRNVGVNTDYVQKQNRNTNVFHIIIPEKITEDDSVEISEVSPLTGINTYNLPQDFRSELPEELKGERIVLCVSNFEKGTVDFIGQAKKQCADCVINLDVTKEGIFKNFSKEYIEEVLKQANIVQINGKTFEALCSKLDLEEDRQTEESENKLEVLTEEDEVEQQNNESILKKASSKEDTDKQNKENIFKKISLKEENQKDNKFFEKFDFDLLTITKGSKGATFLYKEEGKTRKLDMQAPMVYDMKDPTGAGDAFNSIMTMFYHDKILEGNRKIDEKFLKRSFNTANKFVGLVVNQIGARIERRERTPKKEPRQHEK